MLIAPFLAAVVALPLQDTSAEKTISLGQAVPKDAFFLVQATRLDALRADFHESSWFDLYQDDEMKALRESIEDLLRLAEKNRQEKKGGGLESELGVDPWMFFESLHGSIAVFGIPQPGHSEPAAGFLFEPGEERGKFEELFTKLQEKEKEKETGILTTAEYAGVELSLYEESSKPKPEEKKDESGEPGEDESSGEDLPSGSGHSAMFDAGGWAGLVTAASREGLLEIVHGMIDRMSGKDPSTGFTGSEILANARASVSAPGRIEAFVDLSKVYAMLREQDPPGEKADRVLEALALEDLRWAYATVDVGRGEKLGAEFALRLPDSGYLREWFGCLGPFPRDMAALAPRASTSITLAQADVWGIWQSAWKMAREIDPEAAQQARDQMTTMLQQLGGLDVEKSFVSQLDGRFLSFNVQVPPEEWRAALAGALGGGAGEAKSPSSGSAMVIGLRDAQAVSAFVKGLLTAVGMFQQVETEEFQGTTIYKLQSGPGAGVEWAFTKKTGVFSQFPTALRAALRMEGAEAKDSALELESFKPFYASNANAAVLGLASTAESLKSGLSVLEMMGPFITMGMMRGYAEAGGEGEIPNPLEHLPSPAVIERHFKGTLVTSITRKSGVLHFQMASR